MAPGRGYRHLCEIAAGGMGRVYVAVRRDDPEMRLFAVKRLHPHLRDDARARRTLYHAVHLHHNPPPGPTAQPCSSLTFPAAGCCGGPPRKRARKP